MLFIILTPFDQRMWNLMTKDYFLQLKFFISVSGTGEKKSLVFSDQWERWKQTLDNPWRTRVCINAWWDHAPWIFFLFGNQWKKLAFISVEWWGFSFQTWELFFGVRRSKDPHTDQWDNAGLEAINVCNSSAITLVNWNVLSFCVLCILGQRRSLSFICELSKHHF